MSQLKQDEWPADGEPTTTESQENAALPKRQEPASGTDLRGSDPSGSTTNAGTADELRNVTPDEQVD